jgi:hypothetical protein
MYRAAAVLEKFMEHRSLQLGMTVLSLKQILKQLLSI